MTNTELARIAESSNWTKQYFGLTHCGNFNDLRRSSVQDLGGIAILSKWFAGCGFSPKEEIFNSVYDAKLAGEKWITLGV